MPIAVAQAVVNNADFNGGPGAPSVAVNITVINPGATIAIFVTYTSTSNTATVADNVNAGAYTGPVSHHLDGDEDQTMDTFYKTGCASGLTTVTATLSATLNFLAIWAAEISATSGGSDGGNAQDQTGPGTGADAISSGNMTNVSQPALIVGVSSCQDGSSTLVAGTGFTSNLTDSTTSSVLESKRITSTGSTQAATWTDATNGGGANYLNAALIFDESGGGGPTGTGGFETTWAPGRKALPSTQPMGSAPLPTVPVVPKGFDTSVPLARGPAEQASPGSDVPPPRVFTATGYQPAPGPRRPDLGPPRHLAADALPRVIPATTPGTLADATPPVARTPARVQALTGDVIVARETIAGFDPPSAAARAAGRSAAVNVDGTPPSVQPPTGFEHSEPSARVQPGPPRHGSGEPVPPRVFSPTGFEHSEPSARPQPGTPRYVPGEPLPAGAFLPAGFDTAWASGRAVPRPNQTPGGEPEPPSVFTATGYETSVGPRRPDLGPPRHGAGEPVPPRTVGGAGIDTTPAAWRPAPRPQPAAGDSSPPRELTATGYETTAPGARPQAGPPRHLSAEPLRSPVLPQLVRGGDVSPPSRRPSVPPPPPSGQVVTPSVFTATGYETTAPGARAQAGPPRYVSGEPAVLQVVGGAGIENAQPAHRRISRPAEQLPSPAPGALGPAVDSVTVRGRVFAPAQSFGGEAFTTPVWTSTLEAALPQRRPEKSSHVTGEPVLGVRSGAAVPDATWAAARAQPSRTSTASDVAFRHVPLLPGAFADAVSVARRPVRQPLWIDSNGLPTPRIAPPILELPREFEVELSIPLQPPSQFQVLLPRVPQMPSNLFVLSQ